MPSVRFELTHLSATPSEDAMSTSSNTRAKSLVAPTRIELVIAGYQPTVIPFNYRAISEYSYYQTFSVLPNGI